MASIEFDIGLEVPSTAFSAVSSLLSSLKSKITGKYTYSDEKVFVILRDFLQPDTTLSLVSAMESITEILPEGAPESTEVWSFGTICLDLAEQIPYHHPSHQKLARLLEYLGESTKLQGKLPSSNERWEVYNRYQRLGEYVRDRCCDPDEENPGEYVNYQAFVANLERCHIFRSDPTYAVWAMRDAFEENHDDQPGNVRDAYILGAAQWILWNGQNLFVQIQYPGDVLAREDRGWEARDAYRVTQPLTIDRWHLWRDSFRAVAGEKHDASDECKAVSVKAADMMDALEKNMTF